MLATFWFLIKTGVFIALLMGLLSLSGDIMIIFEGYTFSTTLGIFVALTLVVFWVLSVVLRSLNAIINAPSILRRRSEHIGHKKGLRALAFGLSAVAAGDLRMAAYHSSKVTKYLRNDFGLGDLLRGMIAVQKNDEKQAYTAFESMTRHKGTSFLGYKSLITTAIEKKDYRYARVLLDRAATHHPKNKWVMDTQYRMETRTLHFAHAAELLKSLKKNGFISKPDYKSEKAYLLFGLGEWEKAYKHAPQSLPLGLALLKNYTVRGKRRASLNIIKRLWAVNPHPDLMNYWITWAPTYKKNQRQNAIAWIKKLYAVNRSDASSALYCGQALIKAGYIEEAKPYIEQVIHDKPTIGAYQAMQTIDPLSHWTQYLPQAPRDKIWVCAVTGKAYTEWALVTDDKYFNTLTWYYPATGVARVTCANAPALLNKLFQPNLD